MGMSWAGLGRNWTETNGDYVVWSRDSLTSLVELSLLLPLLKAFFSSLSMLKYF